MSAQGLTVAEPGGRYRTVQPVVVDCSALAAVLFDEVTRLDAARALADKTLYAPWLLDQEILSVCAKKRSAGLTDVARTGLDAFSRLAIYRRQPRLEPQMNLSMQHNLSAYDAAYLQLAIELRAPLVTFDKQLGAVAQRVLGDQ